MASKQPNLEPVVDISPQPPTTTAKREFPARRGTPLVCSLPASSAASSSDEKPEVLSAVQEMSAELERGSRAIVLSGPPGSGKTRALRALASERGARPTFFTPFLHLSPREAAGWLAGLLADDMSLEACNAGALPPALGNEARVLMVDEAGSIPEETLRHVVHLIGREAPDIQLVMATSDPAKTMRALGAASVTPVQVVLERSPKGAESVPRSVPKSARPRTHRLRGVRRTPTTEATPVQLPIEAPPRLAAVPPRTTRRRTTPIFALALGIVGLSVAGLWSARGPATLPDVSAGPADAPTPVTTSASNTPAEIAAPSTGAGVVADALTIQVNAAPWAEIQLDGEMIGATPLSLAGVDPGSHELVAIFPGGRVDRRIVEVAADQRFFSFD